jgi:hypothetical protein
MRTVSARPGARARIYGDWQDQQWSTTLCGGSGYGINPMFERTICSIAIPDRARMSSAMRSPSRASRPAISVDDNGFGSAGPISGIEIADGKGFDLGETHDRIVPIRRPAAPLCRPSGERPRRIGQDRTEGSGGKRVIARRPPATHDSDRRYRGRGVPRRAAIHCFAGGAGLRCATRSSTSSPVRSFRTSTQ